jgi:hypothetical protein
MKKLLFIVMISSIVFASCNQTNKTNTVKEDGDEWISLFDGQSLKGWRSFNSDTIHGWVVEEGNLTGLGEGGDLSGDIITEEQFDNFELYLEWKIAPGGNSGVMYHVLEEGHKTTYETGPEYQIIDDVTLDQLEDWQKTAANYAMHVPASKPIKPAGEWNTTRIVVNGHQVEHWLNGEKVLEFEMHTEEWNRLVEEGKWKDYQDYGRAGKGHIALQDHGSNVWFREIKIKKL